MLLFFCALAAPAQPQNGAKAADTVIPTSARTASIPRIDKVPTLDAFLGMKPAPEWEGKLSKLDTFIQANPKDGAPATHRTEAYLGYDDKNLYVIFICFDSEPGKIRARLTRRENIYDDDMVQIMLDTFHDQRRAYSFVVNPLGIQLDRLYSETSGFDDSFDTLWDSEGKLTPQGYVARMAIPFRSLRFPSDVKTWGIVLQRIIPRLNETSYWPRVSSKIDGRLNQEATLNGFERISPGRNIQLIPYGQFRTFRALDQLDPNAPFFHGKRGEFVGGLDSKFVLKDRLVLDFTVHPDFSQVESDEPQVTVNQRFEVFFPEKRPFFLENSNYFDTPISLVFTRRIADIEILLMDRVHGQARIKIDGAGFGNAKEKIELVVVPRNPRFVVTAPLATSPPKNCSCAPVAEKNVKQRRARAYTSASCVNWNQMSSGCVLP